MFLKLLHGIWYLKSQCIHVLIFTDLELIALNSPISTVMYGYRNLNALPAVRLVQVIALCHRDADGSFVSAVMLKWLEGWGRERGEGGAGTPSQLVASSTSAALFIHILLPKAAAAAGSGVKGVREWGVLVGEGLRRLPLTHLEILAATDSTTVAAVMDLQKGKSAVPGSSSMRTEKHKDSWSWF